MTNTKLLTGLFVMAILTTTLSSQNAFAVIDTAPVLIATLDSVNVYDKINMSWTASTFSGATSTVTYDVERSTTGSFTGEETIVSSGQTSTSFSETSLSSGVKYYFRIVPIADDSGRDTANASNIASVTTAVRPSSSDDIYLSAPTFGKLIETNYQYVDDGFSWKCNDDALTSITITDNFHTDFKMVDIKTGDNCTFIAKGHFQNGMSMIGMFFGVPEKGLGHLAEAGVEVYTDYGYGHSKQIKKIDLVQKRDVINVKSVVYSPINCNETDVRESCDSVTINASFNESLKDSVMLLQGIDLIGLPTNTYLNEGFNVQGEQLIDLPSMMIPSPIKYEGLIKVTQSEKYSPIWITEDDRQFEINEYGSARWINQKIDLVQNHRVSSDIKMQSILNAQKIFDGSIYLKSDKGSTPTYVNGIDHREQTLRTLGWLN